MVTQEANAAEDTLTVVATHSDTSSAPSYRERNKPTPRVARVLTLDEHGGKPPVGRVIELHGVFYRTMEDGRMQRCIVQAHPTDADKLVVMPTRRLDRKAKKALKRKRHV